MHEWCSDNEVLKFMAPITSGTTHAIQIINPSHPTHSIIIPLKIIRFTSYFDMRKQIQEEHEDQDNLEIELVVEALPWDPSSSEFSWKEWSIFN